ncbi:MAG: Replication protein P [Pseudomonadales bacterium]|nr:Replication protein P [Pseudomonadales bacterium]|tara:strand:- start:1722 stop:2408 length:687 start_codon:yes stop_codon:yes gene_type:complete
MKTIDDLTKGITENGLLPTLPENRKPARELTADDAKILNRLFADLMIICPAHHRDWPDKATLDAAKQEWTKALVEAGVVHKEQIDRGKRVCRARTGKAAAFLPSLGEFVGWCQFEPEELGLPPLEQAYREALRNSHPASIGNEKWTHKAVFHATLACGRHSLLTLPGQTSRLKFEKAYQQVQKQLMSGAVLSEPPPPDQKALPKLGDPAKARSALDAMRATLQGRANA